MLVEALLPSPCSQVSVPGRELGLGVMVTAPGVCNAPRPRCVQWSPPHPQVGNASSPRCAMFTPTAQGVQCSPQVRGWDSGWWSPGGFGPRCSPHLPWGVGATSHGVVVGGSHPRVGVDGFVHGLLPQLHAKGVQLHCGGHTVCRKRNRDNLNSYCCLTAGKNEPSFCHMQYLKWLNSKQSC